MHTKASLPQLCLFDPELIRQQVKDLEKETTTLALADAFLNVLALEDPRNAEFLRRVQGAVRRHAARTQTGDRGRILAAIKQGLNSAHEIAERLAIPKITVQQHLQKLHDQNLLVRRKGGSQEKGQGGDRRTYLYWLAE